MTKPGKNQDGMDGVREALVSDLYHFMLPAAALASVAYLVRNHLAGISFDPLMPAVAVALPATIHLLRHRIPWQVRAALVVVILALSGLRGISVVGIVAPGVVFLPTAAILGWLFLGWKTGIGVSVFSLLGIGLSAWAAIHGWTPVKNLSRWNTLPMFWVQMAAVQSAFGILVLVMTRRLVQSVAQHRKEIEDDRDRLRGVVEGIQDALFVQDLSDGRFLETNRRAEEMFGHPRARLLEMTVPDISSAEPGYSLEDAWRWWNKARDEGPQVFSWRSKRADGTVFWSEVAMRVFPVSGEDRLLVTVRDMDDRIHDKMELERLNADLEERVARRTESLERSRRELIAFSYAVSHDLRAPLRAVNVYAQVLQEDHARGLTPEAREVVERILASSARMGRIIEALLDLSMLERKRVRLVSVDMDALVGEIREELTVSSAGDTAPDPVWIVEPLPPCFSDPDLIRQVWANLLLNATKFSMLSQAPVIRVSAERGDGWTWYVVRDNGPGFEPEMAEDLFGMFRRGHGQAVEGLGIGLATTKRILLRLDGDIVAESRPGEGAVFRFRVGDSNKDSSAR